MDERGISGEKVPDDEEFELVYGFMWFYAKP